MSHPNPIAAAIIDRENAKHPWYKLGYHTDDLSWYLRMEDKRIPPPEAYPPGFPAYPRTHNDITWWGRDVWPFITPEEWATLPLQVKRVAGFLSTAGFVSWEQIRKATDEQLLSVKTVGPTTVAEIRRWLRWQSAPAMRWTQDTGANHE